MDLHCQYFGLSSFDGKDVELLIRTKSKEKPKELISSNQTDSDKIPFGLSMRSNAFLLKDGWCFVNHGAFGGTLREALDVKRLYEDKLESQPLWFTKRCLLPLVIHSLKCLASFLDCNPIDLAPVTNATVGLNTAIENVLKPGLTVATLDGVYGSVWMMLKRRCKTLGCSLFQIPLNKHLENSNLLTNDLILAEYIAEHLPPNCTVVVLDQITSSTALEIPIWKVIPMLKAKGVQSIVVDGAHAPLQCELAFNQLTKESLPTYYIGNLHKWISCPKSSGFLWSNPSVRQQTFALIVSHGSQRKYLSKFIWPGSTDYSSFLAIPHALAFWTDRHNLREIRQYCSDLLQQAEDLLCSVLQTPKLPRGSPFMKLIRLPNALGPQFVTAKYIQDVLHFQYSIEVPFKWVNQFHYMRISCFVYNSLEDYQRVANALVELMGVTVGKDEIPFDIKGSGCVTTEDRIDARDQLWSSTDDDE